MTRASPHRREDLTARRATSAALALAALVFCAAALLTIATAGGAGAQTPTSPAPSTTAPTTMPTTAPTTAPATAPTTAPVGEVDTGTVPGAEDGTGKALLIGGAFIAIILIGALIARVMPRRVQDPVTEAPPPTDRPADEQPPAPDPRAGERTHGWADEPAVEPTAEPSPRRPLLFDQDQTDGHGWPVTGPRPHDRP